MEKDLTLKEAQKDMRKAYHNGAPGVLISGLVWLVASLFYMLDGVQTGIGALFLGGIFIYPISVFLSKILGSKGYHQKSNPLSKLAIESTFIMLIGFFGAFSVSLKLPEWFFPLMLLSIGARYFVFSTLYGLRVYWVFGGVLCVGGMICLAQRLPGLWAAFYGGGIEVTFAILIWILAKNDRRSSKTPTV